MRTIPVAIVPDLLHPIFQKTLFELGGKPITLLWAVQMVAALLAVGIVTRALKNFLRNRLLAQLKIDSGNREAIATLVSLGIGTFGYLVVLQVSGLDLSSIAVIVGGLGVGIGFGLQDITKNLLSGLTVLFERKLRVGDFIEFDDVAGYIEEIAIRSTVIRTLDGGEVIIPNSQLAEERITNWNYRDTCGRLSIAVGVAYASDPVLVTETLLEAAYSLGSVRQNPPPKVIFDSFGDSALNFKLVFWVDRVDLRASIKSEVTFAVEYYLRQRRISIPFPQLDVAMRPVEGSSELGANWSGTQASEPQGDREIAPAAKPSAFESLRTKLLQISFFTELNELQLRSLIELGFRQQLAPGDVVVEQGQSFEAFCIVLAGEIEVCHRQIDREQALRTFAAGEYFGELPLMLGVPSPGTLRAIAETTLFTIDRANFEKLLNSCPFLAAHIAEELVRRKEALQAYPEVWREMHANNQIGSSPATWIRQRLKELFSTPFA